MPLHRYILASALFAIALLLSTTNRLSASIAPDKSWGWLEPVNITNNLGESHLRTALVDSSGNVHVLWNDNSVYPFSYQLLYRRLNAARNLSPVVVVPGVARGDVPLAALVDEQGTVHLLHRNGQHLLYNKKTLNTAWTQPVTITSLSGVHSQPYLALGSPDTLHAV